MPQKEPSHVELPPGIAIAWGLERPSTRGAKAELSAARIVDAAIRLADKEGLAAVSMARVAKDLGFTSMSLYRHLRSKEELLVLMVDAAFGEPDLVHCGSHSLPAAKPDWRRGYPQLGQSHRTAVPETPMDPRLPGHRPSSFAPRASLAGATPSGPRTHAA